MLEAFRVKGKTVLRSCAFLVAELQQVERGEIAGGVVEEHVFRARIGGADRAGRRAGVPVVHRGIVMQARIRRLPRSRTDLFPQIACLECFHHLAVLAGGQVPVSIIFHRAQELVLERNGIVGVLAGNGEIGVRVPVGVVDRKFHVHVTLAGKLDDALDIVFRYGCLLGSADFALQGRVDLGVEAVVVMAFAIDAGLHDRLHVARHDL